MEIGLDLLDRGRVHADMNFVLDGLATATYDNRQPDHKYGEFVVWNLVIDHPDATILWDTGSHKEAGDGYWPEPLYQAFAHVNAGDHSLPDDLQAAGYSIDEIDAVVMSHLHLDHAGGLHHFAGTDIPIYVHKEELQFAYYSATTDEGSIAYLKQDFDHDLNWSILHREQELFPGIELLHLPGHTPGLVGAHIDRESEPVLVVGDEAYMQANFEDEHPMAQSLLWSNQAWFESLKRAKGIATETDATPIFGHDLDQFDTLVDSL
ncbi:MAG: N-acyl homoserine lactonase family protein [Halobacteriales archaeon]|nr:N-acyl homoserine lactonase family protein [Halobacteriales archaeon]